MILSNRPTVYIKHYYTTSSFPYTWVLDRIIQCEVLNDNMNKHHFGNLSNHFLDLEQFRTLRIDKHCSIKVIDDSDYSRDDEKLQISESVPKNNKIILYWGTDYRKWKTLNKFTTKYVFQNVRMDKYEM